MKVEARPYIGSLDESFLFDNYLSFRWDEVSAFSWSLEEKTTFLQMQFHLKQRSYQQQFPNLETFILTVDSEKVGHYMVAKTSSEIRLVDLFIIPAYRSKGIGSFVMKKLMKKAKENSQTMTLSVFYQNNQARKLYEKLGFVLEKEEVPYIKMRWNPFIGSIR
ncbi:acetyltransferase (GNAT) family protein [Bacillus oleivorans]|uniref:Acetyltransferase (GNAT) family protein n=1 Tax=Bacillus oleivorans TaxID=1448271 RepID=A0A285CHE5_9BACI|nr:GNAT family N-acetyltransferase [Bacillus oleivorans]SNX67014.1 acetyltransferase (GNAT) family protein [Bacillus oleivorans]